MRTNRHLIGKQTFDLRLSAKDEAHDIQHELSRLYWQRVVPGIERLFDRLAGPDELIRLDKLELDLGTISPQDLRSDVFVQKLMKELESVLLEALAQNSPNVISQPLRLGRFDLWLYFLEHGALPAHASIPESIPEWHRHIFETLALDAKAVERLRRLLATRPQAMERLLVQYEDAFLQQVIGLFTGYDQQQLPTAVLELATNITETLQILHQAIQRNAKTASFTHEAWIDALIKALLRRIPALKSKPQWQLDCKTWLLQNQINTSAISSPAFKRQLEKEVWRILINAVIIQRQKANTAILMSGAIKQPTFKPWLLVVIQNIEKGSKNLPLLTHWLQELKADNPLSAHQPEVPINHPLSKAIPNTTETDRNGYFIQNAGIVLLHPFLAQFFKRLELCEGLEFKDDWSRQKAICLLHYLGTGEIHTPEYHLVLPKFLCGLPLNIPLDHSIHISPAEQAEADNLLAAVIEHWGALGSASPDGLREGFLQREGKLEKRPSGWFLRVESKTLDILLDRLPWNLSLLKLPWMEEMLRVEWR
ncbi:MAG: contractile injection system tape measure protein [Haliscomenobacter sp.]|uniref:contractile injection system tape measure protein n=1 Tax=Haliscomenobacter sp. TaxID=2717303 RepID=UPI0029BA095E|nr:contractile injection system tape measure protein [Haliscomenobacter sp.]MDX2070793.1 contractile injection system tape measure protein [Haliscomenobacter sp.]